MTRNSFKYTLAFPSRIIQQFLIEKWNRLQMIPHPYYYTSAKARILDTFLRADFERKQPTKQYPKYSRG